MKLAIAAVSALTLMSVGAANAAIASYDFEGATDGDISLSGALAPLGVISSAITGATGGVTGVWSNGGNLPNASFGAKSFTTGNLGTWTLTFGNGGTFIDSFSLAYHETEGPNGFTAVAFAVDGTTVLGTQNIGAGTSTFTFTGLGTIGKVTITDVGGSGFPNGDNVQLDNLTVNTVGPVPEPSTYLMIGSALAGLAIFRRRRA